MTMTLPPELHATGVDWWNARFGDVHDDTVNFSTAFLPALVKANRLELPANESLSIDELRVLAKYIIADSAWQHDVISLSDFLRYLARFGPLETSLQRLVESLTTRRELMAWFHGTITRAEAEQALLTPSTPSQPPEDGTFLVRFSETHPTRFCLSYLKVHSSGPRVGKREMRNVLIEYRYSQSGFVLVDTPTQAYPSLRNFIARSASRLKNGIASSFSRKCNLELAGVRTRQDMASNSYTSFSTDALEPSSSTTSSPVLRPQHPPSALLFSKTPELSPLPPPSRLHSTFVGRGDNQQDESQPEQSDDYANFNAEAFLPPPLTLKSSGPVVGPSAEHGGGYGSFSAATMSNSPPLRPAKRGQIPVITPPPGAEYGDFSSFTTAVTSFSRKPPSLVAGAAATTHETNNNAYASFASFTLTSTSSSDTYGSFAAFDVSSSTSSTTRAQGQTGSFSQLQGDDYGSFVALSLETMTSSPAPPSSVPAWSVDDTYGTFSISTTGEELPPAQQESATSEPVGAGPRSAPAEIPPPTPCPQDHRESKASALDELNAGMEFYKLKQLDDALLRFIHAREQAQSAEDQVVEARALGNLGTVYLDKQNPQQAVKCYEQCLHITRSIQDVKRERTILNNLVLALMAAEDFDSAYTYCQIQLETTLSEVNRRKILSRMSLLREKAARASRTASARALAPPPA